MKNDKTNPTAPRAILPSDIPAECRDLLSILGLEAFIRLSRLRGSQEVYIPKLESLERAARNREILAQFDGGNFRALASSFQLSERQIRKILKST